MSHEIITLYYGVQVVQVKQVALVSKVNEYTQVLWKNYHDVLVVRADRDVQHNISYSVLTDNRQGAISYASAGEVNPTVTMEWNQFSKNCKRLYGNFTTCQAAIDMDIQNTQTVFFRVRLCAKVSWETLHPSRIPLCSVP